MYVILASRILENGAHDFLPMFYLHENVQGIVSEDHAVKIARDILGDSDNVFVTAHKR